jgi:hypothetical protein
MYKLVITRRSQHIYSFLRARRESSTSTPAKSTASKMDHHENGTHAANGEEKGVLSRAYDSTKEGASNACTYTGDKMSSAYDATKEGASNACTYTGDKMSNAYEGTKEGVSNAYDATKEGASKACSYTGEKMSNAYEGTKEGVSNAYDATKKACTSDAASK